MQKGEYTRETYLQAYHELLSAAAEYGLPAEVGKMMAANLKGEKAIRRMISYLRNVRPRSMEQIADEMLAIMEERSTWIRKKQSEASNASYNEWLNSPRRLELQLEAEEDAED